MLIDRTSSVSRPGIFVTGTDRHQDGKRTHYGRVSQNAEVRDKWRKYVRGVANPRIEDG